MAKHDLDEIGPWSEAKLDYYLYFASPNDTGAKTVRDIFRKYRKEP